MQLSMYLQENVSSPKTAAVNSRKPRQHALSEKAEAEVLQANINEETTITILYDQVT